MFVLEKIRNKNSNLEYDHVVDHDRNAELFFVLRKPYNPTVTTWKLVWDGRVIPFDIKLVNSAEYCKDAKSCQVFLTFGTTKNGPPERLEPFTFKDEEEKERARLLAIEAMLARYFLLSKSGTASTEAVILDSDRAYRMTDFMDI